MGEGVRFKNGHARVETRVLKTLECRKKYRRLLLSIGRQRVGAFKNARVEKMPLNILIQWNEGTACLSECILKTLACRDLRVGPSRGQEREHWFLQHLRFRCFFSSLKLSKPAQIRHPLARHPENRAFTRQACEEHEVSFPPKKPCDFRSDGKSPAIVIHSAISREKCPHPDRPFCLALFDFLVFLVFRFPLLFGCVFPSLSKDFRGSAKRKTLVFFGVSPFFFSKKNKGCRVRALRFGW